MQATAVMGADRSHLRWKISLERDLEVRISSRRSRRADRAFKVAQRTDGRRTVLVVRGDLDSVHAPELGRAVHRALATKPQQLVIDLCQVPFVDYRGLSVLLGARRRARRLGVEISLACDVPRTLRLLERMRLQRAFHIHNGDGR